MLTVYILIIYTKMLYNKRQTYYSSLILTSRAAYKLLLGQDKFCTNTWEKNQVPFNVGQYQAQKRQETFWKHLIISKRNLYWCHI